MLITIECMDDTQQHHNFILTSPELRYFCEFLLPELKEDEFLCLNLFARKKYINSERGNLYNLSNVGSVGRVVLSNSDYETIKRGVMSFCCPFERFVDKNGLTLPAECFGMYISINPLSGRKAAHEMALELADMNYRNATSYNIESIAKNKIQKSVGKKRFMDFDIDIKDRKRCREVLNEMYDILGESGYYVVETKNGAHLILDKENIDPNVQKNFFRDIQAIQLESPDVIETLSSFLLPLPGGFQGGFCPNVIKESNFVLA